jgi:hypothetical protein
VLWSHYVLTFQFCFFKNSELYHSFLHLLSTTSSFFFFNSELYHFLGQLLGACVRRHHSEKSCLACLVCAGTILKSHSIMALYSKCTRALTLCNVINVTRAPTLYSKCTRALTCENLNSKKEKLAVDFQPLVWRYVCISISCDTHTHTHTRTHTHTHTLTSSLLCGGMYVSLSRHTHTHTQTHTHTYTHIHTHVDFQPLVWRYVWCVSLVGLSCRYTRYLLPLY